MGNLMKKRRYKKPFILEAIFEAKFSVDSFDLTIPGQVFEKIKLSYPKKQDIKQLSILNVDNLSPGAHSIQVPIVRALKEDNSELLQVGPGIVVANCMKYSSWDNFNPAIKTILNAYIDSAKPKLVTRVGTRYINRFLIPEESINLSKYFNLGVQIPEALSLLQGFDLTFINKIKSITDGEYIFDIRTKFLTDTLMPGETGNKFILDIDCYITMDFDPDIDRIINLATQAHDTLETVFENIITDEIRALMEVES